MKSIEFIIVQVLHNVCIIIAHFRVVCMYVCLYVYNIEYIGNDRKTSLEYI